MADASKREMQNKCKVVTYIDQGAGVCHSLLLLQLLNDGVLDVRGGRRGG